MVESWVEVRVEAENIPKAEKAVATAVTVLATCYSLIVSILSSIRLFRFCILLQFTYISPSIVFFASLTSFTILAFRP